MKRSLLMSPKLMESRKGGTSISLKGEPACPAGRLTPPDCSNEVGTGGVKTLRYGLTLLSVLLFLSSGCGQANSSLPKFSGTLELTEHLLGAKTAGKIASLQVDEGDQVTKGQMLATLDRYDQTEKDFMRVQQIHSTGGASAQDLEYAALTADDQKIVSPIDGVVLVKVRESGEVVSPGAAVVVVGNPLDLWVKIYVPGGLIGRLRLGQPADVYVDGIQGYFEGHVSFIATKAEFTPRNVQTPEERSTQTFAVKVKINHPTEFLHPGVGAEVRFKTQGTSRE